MNETSELIHKTIKNLSALAKKGISFRKKKLEIKINELKQFCDHFDPYKEISATEMSFLEKYRIYPPYDPFIITNKLLMEMEDSLEELKEIEDEAN